jgi:hypothetical protein
MRRGGAPRAGVVLNKCSVGVLIRTELPCCSVALHASHPAGIFGRRPSIHNIQGQVVEAMLEAGVVTEVR